MTMALCFNCGDVKFGALCPCPKCQVASTGNPQLDIAFSDHHYAKETLEEFGAIIRTMGAVIEDPDLRFKAFIHYVSDRHPEILTVNLEPEVESRIESLLADIVLSGVTIRGSGMHRSPPEESTDHAQ